MHQVVQAVGGVQRGDHPVVRAHAARKNLPDQRADGAAGGLPVRPAPQAKALDPLYQPPDLTALA